MTTDAKRLQDQMQAGKFAHTDPHRGTCDDCGARLTVPNILETTRSGFTDRRESDFQAPEAPEPTPDDSAGTESVSVVEQAARVIYESDWPPHHRASVEWSSWADLDEGEGRADYLTNAQALADAGLLVPDDWPQRAERVEHYVADLQARLEGQRDEARARVAELEAENWDLVKERDRAIVEQRPLVDSLIEARRQRDAAEARARRAEDALRRMTAGLRALADEWSEPIGYDFRDLIRLCCAHELCEALDALERGGDRG